MEKWYVAAKKADFNKWAQEFHISPVLARILRNRDLTESREIGKYLYGTLEDCYSPWLLKDMEKAVEIIVKAVEQGQYIRVIGDYDVDGICSSYILTKGLQIFGARVDTAIPHRIHDGYGLNDNLIEEAKRDGVNLIVTCDNGIAAAAQIELAASYVMSDKIQSTLVNTIPLWKSQMVIAIGLSHSTDAAKAQREVSNMTNELLKKNAENLKTATIETAKESERGIIDIETLQSTNQTLISTLDEVLKIQEEGREKRRNAEVELQKIESEMRDKLLELSVRKSAGA